MKHKKKKKTQTATYQLFNFRRFRLKDVFKLPHPLRGLSACRKGKLKTLMEHEKKKVFAALVLPLLTSWKSFFICTLPPPPKLES
jgi:hypothetical protein